MLINGHRKDQHFSFSRSNPNFQLLVTVVLPCRTNNRLIRNEYNPLSLICYGCDHTNVLDDVK